MLSGKPYLGKPSDMWALGVVLFTMLYGQFPFYDSVPQVRGGGDPGPIGYSEICVTQVTRVKDIKGPSPTR